MNNVPVALLVTVVVVVAELGLRYLDRHRAPPPPNEAPGLRDETVALRREDMANAVRIVVLGDSIPYGWLLSYQQSYPAVMERELRRMHPNREISVINAGVPGNTAVLGWARLERDVLLHQPHLVLVGFGLNDANLARTWVDREREEVMHARLSPSGRVKALLRKSALVSRLRTLWKPTAGGQTPHTCDADPVREPLPRTSADAFEIALTQIVRRCSKQGADVLLLTTTPLSNRVFAKASAVLRTLDDHNNVTRRVATRQQARLVDLYLTLQGRDDWPRMLVGDGVHLRAAGQQIVAESILRVAEPLVARLLASRS